MEDDDEFWSVAMLTPPTLNGTTYNIPAGGMGNSADDGESILCDTIQKSFTILPPPDSDDKPLILNIQMNCNDGILSDVASSIWDAGLLLSGYLYGTIEGRQLCYDACLRNNSDEERPGILELGSGLGIVGMAAAAAALSHKRQRVGADSSQNANIICNQDDLSKLDVSMKEQSRVVLTDLNNDEILSQLRKNVKANLSTIVTAADATTIDNLSITVAPCDWMDISMYLRTDTDINERSNKQFRQSSLEEKNNFPKGPFNLVLGSALVYLPQNAAACADTLFYYLTDYSNASNSDASQAIKKQAIILQLPDRAGFSTHFLPRCKELGLSISCQVLEPELVERVQQGLMKNRSIPSACDYRLYFISHE